MFSLNYIFFISVIQPAKQNVPPKLATNIPMEKPFLPRDPHSPNTMQRELSGNLDRETMPTFSQVCKQNTNQIKFIYSVKAQGMR
jgi:hypothetical protein